MTPLPPPRFLRLVRLSSSAAGTFGHLEDDEHRQLCVTYELPWKDNQHNVSCIPVGEYPMRRYKSPKRGYDVWLLENVPKRDMIEIHIGNSAPDTDGCILVGSHYGPTAKGYGVVNSREAFNVLMDATAGLEQLTLNIVDPPK